jgi:hypothetical protein
MVKDKDEHSGENLDSIFSSPAKSLAKTKSVHTNAANNTSSSYDSLSPSTMATTALQAVRVDNDGIEFIKA